MSSSSLMSLPASSSSSSFSASRTLTRRVRLRPPPRFGQHRLQLLLHLLHARRRHDLDARRAGRAPRSRSRARRSRPAAAVRATSGGSRRRAAAAGSSVEKPSMRGLGSSASSTRSSAASRGAVAHARELLLARHLHGDVGQLLDDGIDLASDVADLGELGRLDLDERRLGEPRQPARDLGLADAGRADHQDVLRRDLLSQRFLHLHATPAVAQRDRHGALGRALADDVLVQFRDDLLRRHSRSSSMTRLRLV